MINLNSEIRLSGSNSLDLAWVACGRYDGFFSTQLNKCALNAGILIVKESGGLMSDFNLDENYKTFENICLGNPAIYNEIIKLIKKI